MKMIWQSKSLKLYEYKLYKQLPLNWKGGGDTEFIKIPKSDIQDLMVDFYKY